MEYRADLRYQGQSTSLTIAWDSVSEAGEQFHTAHQQRYGHRLDSPLELVNLRLSIREIKEAPILETGVSPDLADAISSKATIYGMDQSVPVVHRAQLGSGNSVSGPALLMETNATTWLAPTWRATCDPYGNLMLERTPD